MFSSSAGMDIVKNNAPADDGCVEWFTWAYSVLCSNTAIPKYRSRTHKVCHTQIFQTSNKPGSQKDNQCPSIASNPAKTPFALVRVQMSATHPKTKPRTDTDLCHPLSMAAKNKADSEMPPRDFLEELIYSI